MSTNEMAAIGLAAVLGFWMLGAYNRLVRLRQAIAEAFVKVDAHLRQRHELLAELGTAATAELADAPEVLAAVEAACRQTRIAAEHAAKRPASSGRLASLAQAEKALHGALSRLVTLVKARPALHADARVREAMASLSTTQHRLSAARHGFNTSVGDYNRNVEQFPTRLIAGMLGFRVAGPL